MAAKATRCREMANRLRAAGVIAVPVSGGAAHGVNVWAAPDLTYPTETLWPTTGDTWTWGDRYQHTDTTEGTIALLMVDYAGDDVLPPLGEEGP